MITLLILLYLLSSAGFWYLNEKLGRDSINNKALALTLSLTWPVWLVTLGCMAIWEAL